MRTCLFSCLWDSGGVGFIYVTKAKVRKDFGVKRVSAKLVNKAMELLQAEVSEYDEYLRGNCYGYEHYQNGEEIHSCGGLIGDYEERLKYEIAGLDKYGSTKNLPLKH